MKLILCALFLSLSICVSGNPIYLIGKKANGKEVVFKANKNNLRKKFLIANEEKNNAALGVLRRYKARSSWSLSKFSVGLGLSGEAGIGPWNLGLAFRHRVFFTRGK